MRTYYKPDMAFLAGARWLVKEIRIHLLNTNGACGCLDPLGHVLDQVDGDLARELRERKEAAKEILARKKAPVG